MEPANLIPQASLSNFGLNVQNRGSANLTVETEEGDVVNLNIQTAGGLEVSGSRYTNSDGATVETISTTAFAANSFSISVDGELSEDELSAIHDLAANFHEVARNFFQGNDSEETGIDSLGESTDLGVLSLSIESAIQSTFGAQTATLFAPQEPTSEDDLPPQGQDIRNAPGIVKSVASAVFGNHNQEEIEGLAKTLSQLIEQILGRIGQTDVDV